MALEYYLIPNKMTSNPDDYLAISQSPESYSIEDIFDQMTREGSTVTKAEALAGFEEVTRGIIKLIEQGHSVVTPLVNIKPAISGVFDSEDDRFDPERHKININVSPGIRLRGSQLHIDTEKITPRRRMPQPAGYHDNSTGEQDHTITPNSGAKITGKLLKFDEEDETQGVFFIDVDDGSETKVERKMLLNMPGKLIFNNPDLPPGSYRLEVRTVIKGTTGIKTGTLSDKLTVPAPG